jgi:hypothetical protein
MEKELATYSKKRFYVDRNDDSFYTFQNLTKL